MISGQLLDKLDYIGRGLRSPEVPFGGLQVSRPVGKSKVSSERILQIVLCGDFFQLPPISDRIDDRAKPFPKRNPEKEDVKFAFQAACWNRAIPAGHCIVLNHVYRQEDATLRGILGRMRIGQLTSSDQDILSSCKRPVTYHDDIEAVAL